MKCFRIDDGGEHFHYAAETEGNALTAYLEDGNGEYEAEGAKVREVPEDEMNSVTVGMEDENQFPSGKATLKQVFDFETQRSTDKTILLCSSVF